MEGPDACEEGLPDSDRYGIWRKEEETEMKEKRGMPEDGRHYPLHDNLRYACALLNRKGGREGILICTGDVALRILLPFLTLALPGVAVACLEENGREPVRIFLTMLYVGIW